MLTSRTLAPVTPSFFACATMALAAASGVSAVFTVAFDERLVPDLVVVVVVGVVPNVGDDSAAVLAHGLERAFQQVRSGEVALEQSVVAGDGDGISHRHHPVAEIRARHPAAGDPKPLLAVGTVDVDHLVDDFR